MSRNRAELTPVNKAQMTKRKLTYRKETDNSKTCGSIHGFDASVSGKSVWSIGLICGSSAKSLGNRSAHKKRATTQPVLRKLYTVCPFNLQILLLYANPAENLIRRRHNGKAG
jgi:hypothetical protein